MRKIFLILFFSLSLFAHKLNLFLETENNQLYIYSYFASGSPCKSCKIELFDENNNLLQTLKTNKEGEYYLKEYSKVKYIKIEALGGHAVKKELNLKKAIENKEKKKSIKDENLYSYLQSFIALCLIIVIFILLKRIKV
ncbi:hypothetical protein CP965_11670 [Halarcobacter mediterraneus]|uniref:Cobalt ABC transporter permease n=1 Tax=Halarcobacter mediterraneus TaxID=2023153 RepID=A0A4V1M117_9BACT|nr:hypothetical protein [Halarcobacter mediterraneus]RXK11833.1 hypothetical protein CP965_11670 [Halarcobacter mediterraneus]